METSYKIFVEYYGGLDSGMDQRIMDAVGYHFGLAGPVLGCDSGCCLFGEKARDQVFYLNDPTAVNKARDNLKKIDGIRIKVEGPQ